MENKDDLRVKKRSITEKMAELLAQFDELGMLVNDALDDEIAALKAQPSGVVLSDDQIVDAMRKELDKGDGGYLCDTGPEEVAAAGRALLAEVARLNSSHVSAGDDESRHDAVKALHDVMQSVPCASLYSMAEAVLDAPYGGILRLEAGGLPDVWVRINPCKLYAAPQHDAELVELLRETVEDRSGAIHFMGTDLLDRIDAKLATLSAKNEGVKA